jgi:hypothetical protein
VSFKLVLPCFTWTVPETALFVFYCLRDYFWLQHLRLRWESLLMASSKPHSGSLMVASSDVEKPQPPFALQRSHSHSWHSSMILSSKELGLDGIISGEPQGQTLALILRMWAPRLKTTRPRRSIDIRFWDVGYFTVHQGTPRYQGFDASFTQILVDVTDVFESLQSLQNLLDSHLRYPQVHKLEIAAETLSGSENFGVFGAKGRVSLVQCRVL